MGRASVAMHVQAMKNWPGAYVAISSDVPMCLLGAPRLVTTFAEAFEEFGVHSEEGAMLRKLREPLCEHCTALFISALAAWFRGDEAEARRELERAVIAGEAAG